MIMDLILNVPIYITWKRKELLKGSDFILQNCKWLIVIIMHILHCRFKMVLQILFLYDIFSIFFFRSQVCKDGREDCRE